MLSYAILFYLMLSYAILCYLMLFHVILSNMCSTNQKKSNLTSKRLPDPSQNPSKSTPNQIQEASWPPLGPSMGKNMFFTTPHGKKSAPREAKKVPNPFQNPSQTHPKSIKKCKLKKQCFWKRFFPNLSRF